MKPNEYIYKLVLCEFELDFISKLHFCHYSIDKFVKIKDSGTKG